jgi:hypothetical protein
MNRKLRKKLLRREKRRKNQCMITKESNSLQILNARRLKEIKEIKMKRK